MNRIVNDNCIKTTERKLEVLSYAVEKMEGELNEADGKRKEALLKLIRMGRQRIKELRMLH